MPANEWVLSEEGIQRCTPLAEMLRQFNLPLLYASREPKASQTARLAAEYLGIPWQIYPDLYEHDLGESAGLSDIATFQAQVAALFAQKDEVVFGVESGSQACTRFGRAVDQLITETSSDLCVVAHGRVICLWVARCSGVDGYALWKRLGLPSLVVLNLPDFSLLNVVEQIL